MTAILFKDFNKEVKDLFTKNFQDPGQWKLESKFKGPKDQLYINPQANNKGVSVDLEYAPSAYPVKAKVNLNNTGAWKDTVTFEQAAHKVEATLDSNQVYDVVYEGKFGALSVYDKITKATVDASVSYAVAEKCQVGAGITYTIGAKEGAISWAAGTRYSDKGILVDVITKNLQTYTAGFIFPVPGDFVKNLKVAAQCECGTEKQCSPTVGFELGCPLFAGNSVRTSYEVTSNNWALAYLAKFGDNWKATFSVANATLENYTFGAHFVRE